MKRTVVVVIALFIIASLYAAGCTSPSTTSSGDALSQLTTYAGVWRDHVQNNLDPNEQLQEFTATKETNESISIHQILVSTSKNVPATSDATFVIRRFSTTDAATKFVDEKTFGYTKSGIDDTTVNTKVFSDAYKAATGRSPVNIRGFVKANIVSNQANLVVQTDEFVVYGGGNIV